MTSPASLFTVAGAQVHGFTGPRVHVLKCSHYDRLRSLYEQEMSRRSASLLAILSVQLVAYSGVTIGVKDAPKLG